MLIEFANKEVQQICEDEKVAQKKLGAVSTRKLQRILSAMRSANNMEELPRGLRPHPLKGDRKGSFALDLDKGRRLVFHPANDPLPLKADGGLDRIRVTIVGINYIGDYHD